MTTTYSVTQNVAHKAVEIYKSKSNAIKASIDYLLNNMGDKGIEKAITDGNLVGGFTGRPSNAVSMSLSDGIYIEKIQDVCKKHLTTGHFQSLIKKQ
jgi:hypothetical protein